MKVVNIILAIVCILILIVVIRAQRSKAPKKKDRLACSKNEEELARYAKDFGELLKIETISKNEDEDLSQFVKYREKVDELFPLCKETLEKTVIAATLVYRWKGKDSNAKPILLMGHQDVVPASKEGWSHDPFSGDYEDGILWGRGTVDDKCNLFTQMSAIEQLIKEGFVPPVDIYLEYSFNEETSGNGASLAVRFFKERNIEFAMVVDEGGAVLDTTGVMGIDRAVSAIGITEKGYINVKFTANGKGGHSSTPAGTTNVTKIADLITTINHDRPFERKITPELKQMLEDLNPILPFKLRLITANLWLFGPLVKVIGKKIPMVDALLGTTVAFTMMEGSHTENVLPGKATAVANLRTGYTQGVDESVAIMKKYADRFGLEMEVYDAREASSITRTDTKEFDYLKQCIKACYPDTQIVPYIMTGGTDCRHMTAVSENCLRFCPMRMTIKQESSMHGVNENVNIDAVSDAIDFYKYFIKNYKVM